MIKFKAHLCIVLDNARQDTQDTGVPAEVEFDGVNFSITADSDAEPDLIFNDMPTIWIHEFEWDETSPFVVAAGDVTLNDPAYHLCGLDADEAPTC